MLILAGIMRLSALYQTLTTEERAELAKKAGTSPAYLYQIATQWKGRKPSLQMLLMLSKADARLTLEDLAAEFDEAPATKVA